MQFTSPRPGAFRVGLLLLAAALLRTLPADAQWYTVLHVFNGTDGMSATSRLVQGQDGNFYGTTVSGGSGGKGVVFTMTPAGALTMLHSFSGSDGQSPVAGLVQGTDGNLYGTTQQGGASGVGTVFRITTSGTLTTLHSFAGGDGANPLAPLVQGSDGSFYGTTFKGGANGSGTVFRITPAGGLTTLASFAPVEAFVYPAAGTGGLVQGADGSFYGTITGGAIGWGSVFRITPSGALTTLHSFAGMDGGFPSATLVAGIDGNFYGTTGVGGSGDASQSPYLRGGTVFRITPSGTLTTLTTFPGPGSVGASLAPGADGNLWGTTAAGGRGCGTAFRMTQDGILTTLVELPGSWNDGCSPFGGLAQGTDGSFYGTTSDGGDFGAGVVFRVTQEPELLLPVVLDNVGGIAGSRYSTELTLASKATGPIQVKLVYTASVGSGSGSTSFALAPGETRIIPNAIAFLRSQGLAILTDGASVGTLRATFVGARPSDDPFVGARTYTAGGGGTFGVFYPASATTPTTATLLGLQQNFAQRSNLALVNAGATPLTLHVHLFGPMGEDLGALPDQDLPPFGWKQINGPLEGKATSGRAVVSGPSPFTAYAVLNDAFTSAGSFIPPLIGNTSSGLGGLVPIVLDVHGFAGSHYTTELTLANLTKTPSAVWLTYAASLGSGSGQAALVLDPGEQRIVPDAIAFLRSQGLAIPDDGSAVGGSLSANAAIGSRTFTPAASGKGSFGTYIPGVAPERWASAIAYVNGLQQNPSQRSNVAVVNCGDASDSITLRVSFFDGTGVPLGTPTQVALAPGQWTQYSQPLAAFGAAFGYARIEKTSGGSRFVAYGILNDAVTSDGSYIPMSF